jgi:hypothetical protein
MSITYKPTDKILHENFFKATAEQQRSYASDELKKIIKGRATDLWSKDTKQNMSLTKVADEVTKGVRKDLAAHIDFVYPKDETFKLKTKDVKFWIKSCAPQYALDINVDPMEIDYEFSETPNLSICDEAPKDMNLYFNWVVALDAWDYGINEPLSKMMNYHAVPVILRPIIAKIISGERQQKLKANSIKIPAGKRLLCISAVLALEKIPTAFLSNRCVVHDDNGQRINQSNISIIADKNNKEVSEVRTDLNQIKVDIRNLIIDKYNVSPETIKSLKKVLKEKISQWPDL